jgi:SP family general alpha glucoside:H+ symporter-like MFS transporter
MDSSREKKAYNVQAENEAGVNYNSMFANAQAATGEYMNLVFKHPLTRVDREHRMTLWEGLRKYPKACAWSVLISTTCAMEGYDISLIGNFCEGVIVFPCTRN